MNISLRLALALCLAVALCLPASAANPKTKKSPTPAAQPSLLPPANANTNRVNVRIDVLMVAMPEDKFIALLPDLLDKDKIEKVIPDLLDAVKRKEMILEGYPIIVTKSGQRALSETVKEVRYPSEPANFAVPDVKPTAQSGLPPGTIGDPSTPTEYETRNTGASFEVEPVASPDGQYIDLNLAPQQVQLLGFLNTPQTAKNEGQPPKDDSKLGTVTKSPLFYTMKDTTSVTLRNGQHMLLGVHKTAQPEGNIEVFIVHAEILPSDK